MPKNPETKLVEKPVAPYKKPTEVLKRQKHVFENNPSFTVFRVFGSRPFAGKPRVNVCVMTSRQAEINIMEYADAKDLLELGEFFVALSREQGALEDEHARNNQE